MRSTIITGVSTGLGAALFDHLHVAGDRILALGRRFTPAQHAAADETPDRTRLRRTDLSDPTTLPNTLELTEWIGQAVDESVLIHNAAVFTPFGLIGTLDPQEIQHAVTVNLTSPLLLTNALLASAAAEHSRTTIMLITSSAARHVDGGRAVYAATKRASELVLETVRVERGEDRIRVVVVDPGIMDTPMQATVRGYALADGYFPGRERFLDRYQRGLPSPDDVARKIIATHL
jgi:benzil reductase ((S)-benzoin forming)